MSSFSNTELIDALTGALADNDLFDSVGDVFSREGDDGNRHYQATFKARFDDTVKLVVTLPTRTTNIYVTATDGDVQLVRQVLSTIEALEREVVVNLGNVLLLNGPELEQRAICGVQFMLADFFTCLEFLPARLLVNGVEYRLLSVVFLTDDDHRIWKEKGHDALMDHWEEIGHDLIAFGRDRAGS